MLKTSIIRIAFIQTSLHLLSKSDILWNDPLNSTNGAYIDWNISGTVDPPYTGTTPELFCPSTNGCWRFTETSSAYYIASTVPYYNLSITYSHTDACDIYYSIDATTDWTHIHPSSTTATATTTIALPSTTFNNIGVGIKITSQQSYCYFSDISFEGERIPKSTQKPQTLFENIQQRILSLPTIVLILCAVVVVFCVVLVCVICCNLCSKKSVQNTKKQMDHTLNVDMISDPKTGQNVYGNGGEVRKDAIKNGNAPEPVLSTSSPVTVVDTPTKASEKPETVSVDVPVADNINGADCTPRESVTDDDSLMRKQRQYEFEEECKIEDGDVNTPLPDFPTNLNLQITTESVVLEHIMSDMKQSQLRLEAEKPIHE